MSTSLRTADGEVLTFPSEDQMNNYVFDLSERDIDLTNYTVTDNPEGVPNYRYVGGRLLHIPGSPLQPR